MAEAIALSPRVAFSIPGFSDEIVAGRRSDGRWSVYFGGDPVYHFDADGRLRRAFLDGQLYRTEGQTLSRLTRQESSTETVLLRHDLTESELTGFQNDACLLLNRLATSISRSEATVRLAIPPDANFLPELVQLIRVVLDAGCQLATALK